MEPIKYIGLVLVIVSAILILCSLLRKKESFFNLRQVIKKHLAVFKECKFQYLVFYGFPMFFSIGLAMIYKAGETFYSELSVIMGILLSMLFAILSILAGHDFSTVKDEQQRAKVKSVVKETVNAIVFDSILCLFLMIYGLVVIVLDGISFSSLPFNIAIVKAIISGVAYYIFSVILLNLLLIVKHMSKIIEFNLKAKKENDK